MMKGVNVEIMGQSLIVASDGGDEWTRYLAATVDDKIKQIRAGGKNVNSINLVILAALNLAEELERLRQDHHALLTHLESLNRLLSTAV
ncbi:MAG: cell division protein ZapA [Candidatus Binataceae bacterium]|jgi:cell division protein ZapA (FtsZ GTPase activity inhibitor)